MFSFRAKIGRERPRKSEKKKIVLISSYLTRNRELKKNSKKIRKIKKHPNVIISSQNWSGEAEKEREKKLLFRSVPNRSGIENSKKIAKKFKKLKNIIMPSFQAKMGRDSLRTRKKNYCFD